MKQNNETGALLPHIGPMLQGEVESAAGMILPYSRDKILHLARSLGPCSGSVHKKCQSQTIYSQDTALEWALTTISLRMFCSKTLGIGRFMSLTATSSFVFLSSARYVSPVPPAAVAHAELRHLDGDVLPEKGKTGRASARYSRMIHLGQASA